MLFLEGDMEYDRWAAQAGDGGEVSTGELTTSSSILERKKSVLINTNIYIKHLLLGWSRWLHRKRWRWRCWRWPTIVTITICRKKSDNDTATIGPAISTTLFTSSPASLAFHSNANGFPPPPPPSRGTLSSSGDDPPFGSSVSKISFSSKCDGLASLMADEVIDTVILHRSLIKTTH